MNKITRLFPQKLLNMLKRSQQTKLNSENITG